MSNSHKIFAIIFCTLFSAIIIANHDVFAAKDTFFLENNLNSTSFFTNNPSQPEQDPASPGCTESLNRMGYGITQNNVDLNNGIIDDLRVGLYLDWRVNASPTHPNCAEYIQVIRLKQHVNCNEEIWDPATCSFVEPYSHDVSPSISAITAAAQARPGSIWLVGNEIDRYGQDYMLPDYYAEVYHDLYQAIKETDPTAQVSIAGVVQPTALRLEYLTKIWDTYQSKYGQEMPVDVWNVHNFIMQEKSGTRVGAGLPPGLDNPTEWDPPGNNISAHVDMGLFDQQIRAFRQWMKDRGQQEKPLIVSEYGVLYWHCEDDEGKVIGPNCDNDLYDPDKVANFMTSTFDYFLNTADCDLGYSTDGCRLVQRWVWYGMNEDGTDLFNPEAYLFRNDTNNLSHTGGVFRDYAVNHVNDDYGPITGQEIPGFALSPSTVAQHQMDQRVFLPLIQR